MRVGKAASVVLILAAGAAVVAWSCWTLADWTLPRVVRGQGDAFKTRILERYPVGSSEQALISDLRKEGFEIELYAEHCPIDRPSLGRGCYSIATYDRPFIIPAVSRGWQVVWVGNEGRIAEISASKGSDGP